MLDEQAGRRRGSSPGAVIRIMVDGVERGRMNPAEQSSISFSAEENAEIIEVKSTDLSGDLLLATHVLNSFSDAAIVSSIRLEGGQDLSLSITRRQIEGNGGADLLVKFGYRETAPRRAVRLWWHRQKLRQDPNSRSMWSGALLAASVLVAILLTSYLAYVMLRPHPGNEVAQTSVVQTTPPGPTPAAPASIPPVTNKPTPKKRPAKIPNEEVADAVRSSNAVPNLKLSEVKKIYVEIRGDAPNNLRTNIIESLNSSGLVTTASADEADAALKIVVSQTSTSAQLVNARGTVLWRGRNVKDLLSEIRKR